ncbi:FAD/NAD(P)-binding domain-containing protein [Stipitochalara longipes BDJ]|nr:FAD/NAD(P)-binding domain-containing protein [Stipitochalara longipes BDJ]
MFPESSYYWIPGLLVLASPLLFRLLSSSKKKKTQGLTGTDTETTSPTTTKKHTVVVLGAGLAGVPLTHHLLKHTPASVGLCVVLVSPNDEMLWTYATVRAILPDGFGDEKIFHPLGPGFAKYGLSKFEHVVGMAQSLDPEANRVVVSTKADEQQRIIDYDTLVIATGSSFKEGMPFKNLADTAATKDEIHSLRKKIAVARSIVVAGAGQTGVEVAGELGQEFGLAGSKEITLIADDALPLGPEVRDDVRRTAVSELAKLKVKVVTNTHVVGAVATPAGKQSLALRTSGKNKTDTATTTLETDLYIPCFGVRPNTAFVPATMLDVDDRVKVDRNTLQATGYANVFALGDASNAQTANGKHADAQVRFLAPAMQARLGGCTMPTYKADDTFVFAVTLGPYRGTGQVGSWRLWGWIIRMTIGKHMGTDYASEIAAGNRTMTETKW